MTLDQIRPSWLEIDLDSLAHNMKEIRKIVRQESLITAVVKANAYGHGAVESSKVFLANGGDRLAVASLEEAIELRQHGIQAPIMVLGYTPESRYQEVLEHNIIQTIYSYSSAKCLSEKAGRVNKKALIHIKIDTGMGRIGYLPGSASIEEIVRIANLANIEIEGVFTHFATSDERDKSFTRLQYDRFMDMVDGLEEEGLDIAIKHVSNSAAIIDLPEYNLDMVRAGIILYGLYPSNEVEKSRIKLRPAMTLKSRISNIKIVAKDYGISYGQVFKTREESKIATIPLGYADGYPRLLTGQGQAFVNGELVDLVGRICMDQLMLDVSKVEDISLGDEVILFGNGIQGLAIDDMAEKLTTINYEIVCMMGRRLPRVYMEAGKIQDYRDYIINK